MKKKTIFLLIFIIFVTSYAFTFQLDGNLFKWKIEHFLGFDDIGDCESKRGDISSSFAYIENGKLFLRITFNHMSSHYNNKIIEDNFADKNLTLFITVKANKKNLANKKLDLSNLNFKNNEVAFLRTPENNLVEIEFDLPAKTNREEINFYLRIVENGKVIDSYQASGNKKYRGGNCAFAHHGNQGLTYTEVFYGQDPQNSSGFDEILEVHQATGIPGNFHMSGTLMPAAEWHDPAFNDWLSSGVTEGYVAMLSSALGQHIMPFMQNEMNDWSVNIESDMVDFLYNYVPKVAWVPERVWLTSDQYPNAGVNDWLGDNWTQHGIEAVILDDSPHCSGYSNTKIHWMNNVNGIDLRIIPINNTFVGNMHYDADAAKNQINSTGQYDIVVYGTDWEVAAEMNEHHGTMFLDNYENVIWYCYNNYPAINVWKLDAALNNSDFNGSGIDVTPGTYGLLGGGDGYGGSNNSWYTNWAATESHSDFHDPKWNYGYIWDNAYNNIISAPDNDLSQLAWYTMMINLHETGWHTDGEVAGWEHRYSSHIKNANVYAEVSRWANGDYTVNTNAYFSDIDRDGGDELIMHNDKVFYVIEGIGGKANWIFYKDDYGNAYSVVGSDVAYWSETDGDYNESSYNHFAALSDVSPNQQHSIYDITINSTRGDSVQATLTQWGVSKTLIMETGNNFLDVIYNFYDQTGYVKSGWTPDLLDLIWSGKSHLQRMWGDYGSYCGQRNSASGATVALVLGNGGASHNGEFEGTLVKGDEIKGYNELKVRLYSGWTSAPYDTNNNKVAELDSLASENMDIFPPILNSNAFLVNDNEIQLTFSEAVDETTAENTSNYSLQNFIGSYTILAAERQDNWNKVNLFINETFQAGDSGKIYISDVEDLNGNNIPTDSYALLHVPSGITPHTINIDGINDFDGDSELVESQSHTLDITWDNDNLYVGFYDMDLNSEGDLFVNIDTDQNAGSGATTGSWGRVDFSSPYLPEYQVAVEGGGGSMQVNNWTAAKGWNYPGNGIIGNSYEGWSGNGFTEISVPWSALGDPQAVALSVHITEEDNNIVPEAFPFLNPTGDHPTLNYIYAFFTPYISDDMPVSGMEPKDVFIIPNSSPEITDYLPDSLDITIQENDSLTFSVTATDTENDELTYTWKLDGVDCGYDSSYTYVTDYNSHGLHSVTVNVTDMVPGNSADTLSWTVEVINFILNSPQVSIEIENDDVVLTWTTVDSADGYKIYRSNQPNSDFVLLDSTSSTSYTDTDAGMDNKKFYKISAYIHE